MPAEVNKAAIMMEHFSQFGEVVKVVPNVKKSTCLVHFADHAAAKTAKAKGKMLRWVRKVRTAKMMRGTMKSAREKGKKMYALALAPKV